MLYSYIAIEGNIGSGKTTLATMLANDIDARLVLEQFADNPFLPKFYQKPEKNAFPLELFFMAERYHQLRELKSQDLFQPNIVSDYFFVKSKLFAQNNLKKDELQLFNRLFDIMISSLLKPDILLYLYADLDRLQKNIRKRGRAFEQDISDEYLQKIKEKYLDYLKKQNDFPVLILDVTVVDFVSDVSIYEKIKELLKKEFASGVHNFVL